MKTIKNFLKGLIGANGSLSSKRFAGILCICACVLAFLSNLYFRYIVNEALFNALLLFAAGCFGMNTFLTSKSMKVKENVASGIVETEQPGANKTAKEVLQSDNP